MCIRSRVISEHPFAIGTFVLFGALPDHARKTLERHQRRAGISPLLQFLDRDVIERLPAGAATEKRARDIHHMPWPRALVYDRRSAARAETAHRFAGSVLVAHDLALALGDAKTLAPASDIRCVSRAMRPPAFRRMIVPGPARWYVDLKADAAA